MHLFCEGIAFGSVKKGQIRGKKGQMCHFEGSHVSFTLIYLCQKNTRETSNIFVFTVTTLSLSPKEKETSSVSLLSALWSLLWYSMIWLRPTTHFGWCKLNYFVLSPILTNLSSLSLFPKLLSLLNSINFFSPRAVGYGGGEQWRRPCNKLSSCQSRKCFW